MGAPNMTRAFACAKNAVALVANKPIPDPDIHAELDRILKEKDVIASVSRGSLTAEQGAKTILDDLEAWTIKRCSLPEPVVRTWDLEFVAEDLEGALFG
jgi:hypothetical protein